MLVQQALALGERVSCTILRHEVGVGYSTDALVQAHAALFLPDARYKIIFYDIHALNLPILTPDKDFYVHSYMAECSDNEAHPVFSGGHSARRLLQPSFAATKATPFLRLHDCDLAGGTVIEDCQGTPRMVDEHLRDVALNTSLYFSHAFIHGQTGQGNFVSPRLAHWDWACDSLSKIGSWWELSEWARFPGVLHFGSAVEALRWLLDEVGLRNAAETFRDENARMVRKAMYFWDSAIQSWIHKNDD
eukprot:TRINITY_DN24797_c0_g1_i1.p2 TRINITY_DN24797_c0_g1~~TRINITY_DN24797_c0_g1_i1.p2  ORF type:complete len:247 (-),score=22.73 TRINITY_DN24797_c0_g1_i1:1086-1826(-)